MVQYLLNVTAIWLVSLVLFDIFLRKESYHNYNRFYLLFTFLLGALFPLIQWSTNNRTYPIILEKPIAEVITAKQTIIAAATLTTSFDWQQWLYIVYVAGAITACALLLVDIAKLVSSFRRGKKSRLDGWTVIETGKDHAPFSFMYTLFVSSRRVYSDEEWTMIINHERRHTVLMHFADLLLMQLARIVFWFHPLVYIYNRRILMVHEYQADKASAQKPQVYGKFLIAQALLGSAPTVSHSFNHSPIKKRILMLTRRSSALAKSKMLLFVPLASVCILCFSQNSFSQKKGGISIIVYPLWDPLESTCRHASLSIL